MRYIDHPVWLNFNIDILKQVLFTLVYYSMPFYAVMFLPFHLYFICFPSSTGLCIIKWYALFNMGIAVVDKIAESSFERSIGTICTHQLEMWTVAYLMDIGSCPMLNCERLIPNISNKLQQGGYYLATKVCLAWDAIILSVYLHFCMVSVLVVGFRCTMSWR